MSDAKPLSREAWEGIVFLVERDGYVMVGANYAPGLIATVRAAAARADAERERAERYRVLAEKARGAMAPCCVGWDDGQMPVWAEKLLAAVHEINAALAADDQHRAAQGEGT